MTDYTSPLDNLLHSTSAMTLQYERQLKELEVSHLHFDFWSHLTFASSVVETRNTLEQLEDNRQFTQAGLRRHSSEI